MNPDRQPAMSDAEKSFFARYRSAPKKIEWNQTIATLLAHRSVRSFERRPLTETVITTLIAAASSAPSSSNLQAWSVIAITDPQRRAKIAALSGNQQHIIDAPLLLIWLADLSRAERLAEQNGQELAAIGYLDSFLVASIDAALAAQNAMIAAQSMGLGTVYIGAIRNDAEAITEILNLPNHCYAMLGLLIGHPDPATDVAIKPRLPQAAVLHHETYRPESPNLIAVHDRDIEDFRRDQQLSPQNWSSLIIDRLRSTASLHGRDRLRDFLNRIGFRCE